MRNRKDRFRRAVAVIAFAAMAGWQVPLFGQKSAEPRVASRGILIQQPSSSFLGIGVAEIDAERARVLKLKEEHGVEIRSVEQDSPAAEAGLQVGDVVMEYNGQRVEGVEQFIRLVRETPAGRLCHLTISRNGATQKIEARLAKREHPLIGPSFEDLDTALAKIPEIRLPDMPRSVLSWRSPTLGIESEALGSQLAEYFGVKEGVLVRSVIRGSAAEKAGLKAGDVIVEVDGKKVASPREVATLLRSLQAKKPVLFSVVRERKEVAVTVVLDDSASIPRDLGPSWLHSEVPDSVVL